MFISRKMTSCFLAMAVEPIISALKSEKTISLRFEASVRTICVEGESTLGI